MTRQTHEDIPNHSPTHPKEGLFDDDAGRVVSRVLYGQTVCAKLPADEGVRVPEIVFGLAGTSQDVRVRGIIYNLGAVSVVVEDFGFAKERYFL